VEYVQGVKVRDFARKYWFDLLIAALAVASMLELIVGRDSARTTLWFGLPALAILVLPIFARRRFPFGGPIAYWVLAAGISLIAWQLIPSVEGLFSWSGLRSPSCSGTCATPGRRLSAWSSSSAAW
jgi:hypothetical protein